jgi:hypothetical protein
MVMKNEMFQAMEIVAPRILEEAAFLFSEPLDEAGIPPEAWDPIGVELRWNGPSTGIMRLWADPSLLAVLAANMLGTDEDDPVSQAKGLDALKESLNMIVGNCLTEAWGPGPVFLLDVPLGIGDRFTTPDREEGLWLLTEGKPVFLWCGA